VRLQFALGYGLISLILVTSAYTEEVWVRITEPRDGALVIGKVAIAAEVMAREPVEGVEFRVDGRTVGMVTSPPYHLQVDLRDDNTVHRFEAIARCTTGEQARDSVTTQPVPISGRFDVELQQLYVAVTDHGERVLDLRPEDFEVVDEMSPQDLVTFELGDVPLTAVLLIDSSWSMAGDKLQAAIRGATAFVENMEALDQVKLMFFSDQLQSTTRFSDAGGVNSARLAVTRATGGTALYDYLYVALKLLEQRQGRRVIILLSDGVDSHSTLGMEAVADLARRCQAQIHWIRLRGRGDADAEDNTIRMSSAWRSASEYRHQLELLKETVSRSGGDTLSIDSIEQIEEVFLEILGDLREQYVLGYYPSNRRNDGAWHEVHVRVARRGLNVRVAKGYVDY
jgi:Ca-activated chloride channel family protein